MKVAIKKCFYNGRFDGIFGFGITLNNWLKGEFNSMSHAELVFSGYGGMSFSSIECDQDNMGNKISGARFKKIEYSHPDRWIFLDWDFTDKRFPKQYSSEDEVMRFIVDTFFDDKRYLLPDASFEGIINYCVSMKGRKYDKLGIAGQSIGASKVQDNGRYFCSEAVGTVMGYTNHPSPSKLYNQIRDALDS